MHRILKTTLACAVWTVVTTTFAVAADDTRAQQKIPIKPIGLLVPSSAGTTTATLARMMGATLSESWEQPVVVVAVYVRARLEA